MAEYYGIEPKYIGKNNADNGVSTSAVVANATGTVLERLQDLNVKLGGGSSALRVVYSDSETVEENAVQFFNIGIFDADAGAIASGSIDITGISAVMEKSTGGAAFSSAGITQPTFSKANGSVYCAYQFLAAQWVTGDMYKLVVSGITATIHATVAYIPSGVWSNVVVETEDIKNNVQYLYGVADGGTVYPTKVLDNSILSIIMTKASGGDTSNFDNSTDSLEAIADAVSGIGAAGGAAINTDCTTDNVLGAITGVTSGTTFKGTQTSGTFASTSALDGTKHVITGTDTGNTIFDIVYQFLTGGGTSPVACVWTGLVNTTNDTMYFYAWNHVGGAWELLGEQVGQTSSTANVAKNLTLYPRHSGTSAAELGKIYIRLYSNATTPVVRTDQIYATYAVTSRSAGYENGAVWIDTVHGTAGTELFVNGTADKPSLTLADALTIATNLGGIHRLRVANGSSITLTASVANYTMIGSNWTLALGSQAITAAYIEGATISGISSGTGASLRNCTIGDATIGGSDFCNCSLAGTFTTIASGDYNLHGCIDALPGTGTNPIIVLTANTDVGLRDWAGGIQFNTIAATNNIAVDGRGRVVLHTDCVGGTLLLRGPIKLTDNVVGGWTGTLTDSEKLVGYTGVGQVQIVQTTESLNQAASSYDLLTGTTQAVLLESLSAKMPAEAAGGALTSISIQTDDATPGVIISSTLGVVANLTSEAELAWTGCMLINTGTKIQLTIAGGAHGSAYVATVTAKYRAVVAGGTLA